MGRVWEGRTWGAGREDLDDILRNDADAARLQTCDSALEDLDFDDGIEAQPDIDARVSLRIFDEGDGLWGVVGHDGIEGEDTMASACLHRVRCICLRRGVDKHRARCGGYRRKERRGGVDKGGQARPAGDGEAATAADEGGSGRDCARGEGERDGTREGLGIGTRCAGLV